MKFSKMPYERVDMEELKQKMQDVMKEFAKCESGEEQFAVHKKYYELTNHAYSMMTIAHIRHDIDMKDEFYDNEQTYYDKESPAFQQLVVEYTKLLYESKYRDYLEEKIGKVAFKNIELDMKAFFKFAIRALPLGRLKGVSEILFTPHFLCHFNVKQILSLI